MKISNLGESQRLAKNHERATRALTKINRYLADSRSPNDYSDLYIQDTPNEGGRFQVSLNDLNIKLPILKAIGAILASHVADMEKQIEAL